MKIFNWVHRRFHQGGGLKEGQARNVKKAESITSVADKQALLKQVALADVLDGWKSGILTIGTLGIDPLKLFNQQNEYVILESEDEQEKEKQEQEAEKEKNSADDDDDNEGDNNNDDDDDDCGFNDNVEDEEENPLLFRTFDRNFEDFELNLNKDIVKSEIVMAVDGVSEIHDHGKKKGERITLAELFLADSDVKKKPDFGESESDKDSAKKQTIRAKNGLSFAKKFMPGEDSRPTKKLHQLMRRMLKRKIHPELGGKGNSKTDIPNKPAAGLVEGSLSKENEVGELVSLLQTPTGASV